MQLHYFSIGVSLLLTLASCGGTGSANSHGDAAATEGSVLSDASYADHDTSASDNENSTNGSADSDGGSCGNGRIDENELCDIALADSCPETCTTSAPCTSKKLFNAGTCQAYCGNELLDVCADDDGCCPNTCTQETDSDCPALCEPTGGTPECGGVWIDGNFGRTTRAGLGLREPPLRYFYGNALANEQIVLPTCAHLSGDIRIPVVLIDWSDFDPETDPAYSDDESVVSPYVRSTPEQISNYLNSTLGKYYSDTSGQNLTMTFDLYGWITDDGDRYLKTLSHYSGGTIGATCNRPQVAADAIREAIASQGLDLTQYDADCNGMVDGVVIVYEGGPGACLEAHTGAITPELTDTDTPPIITATRVDQLVSPEDPNVAAFKDQRVSVTFYAALPEVHPSGKYFTHSSIWAHEIGHLLWGYADYYNVKYAARYYMISANNIPTASHPAALEKWLFGHWITPQHISTAGTYTLAANEIADGSTYAPTASYLYVIDVADDPRHFFTIEARWLADKTNTASSWAADSNARESGLVIFEVNLSQPYSSDTPHIFRHAPEREDDNLPIRAHRPGDQFHKCIDTQCVTITPLGIPGATAGFELGVTDAT